MPPNDLSRTNGDLHNAAALASQVRSGADFQSEDDRAKSPGNSNSLVLILSFPKLRIQSAIQTQRISSQFSEQTILILIPISSTQMRLKVP